MKTFKTTLFIGIAVILGAAGDSVAHAGMASGNYTLNYDGSVNPVWDISGSYSESVDAVTLDYAIVQDATGKFTGTGNFDIDESYGGADLSLTSSMNTSGTVKSAGTVTRVTLTATGAGDGSIYVYGYGSFYVTFSYNLKEKCEVDSYRQLVGTISGRVKVTIPEVHRSASVPVPATDFAVALPVDSTGAWSLTLNLVPDGMKYTGTAMVQTSTGATVDYTVTGNYSSKTDRSKLSITRVGSKLSMVGSANGVDLIVESLKGKLYGQTLKLAAP